MSMFEVYLLKPAGGTPNAEAVLDALGRERRIGLTADDPSRAHYRNPDTGAFFSMLLAPEVTDVWHARMAAARHVDDGRMRALVDAGPYTATEAKAAGLVDGVKRDELHVAKSCTPTPP